MSDDAVFPPRDPRGASLAPFRPAAHPDEAARLESVLRLAPLVRAHDALLHRLCREAADCCDAPVAMVSMVEDADERVLATHGFEVARVERRHSFCAHTILEPDILVVEDATRDPRFERNPFVVGDAHARFYAGAPVFDATGLPLGAVCVFDVRPREIPSRCLYALRAFAGTASALLQARLLFARTLAADGSHPPGAAEQARLDAILIALLDARRALD